jgi:methionyl-tRNA formyltransferase
MKDRKLRVLFMGRKLVSAEALLYVSRNENVEIVGVLTDNHLAVSPTTEMANRLGLKTFSFSEALSEMKNGKLPFDLGISILYWRKLKEEFLSIPSLGIVNFHPAPLPEYKGTAGYNLAILDGLEQWAVSAHYVDENIDAGNIIEVEYFDISPTTETAQTLEKKSQPRLLELFKAIFDRIVDSRQILSTRPNKGGRYVSRDEMESMKEVKPGDDISKKIRAFWFPPYNGAFINIEGKKFTLVDDFILQTLADPNSSSLFSKKSE